MTAYIVRVWNVDTFRDVEIEHDELLRLVRRGKRLCVHVDGGGAPWECFLANSGMVRAINPCCATEAQTIELEE